MFGGGGGGHQHQQQQHQNNPSDSSLYQAYYARSHCDNYLCPDTLGMYIFAPGSVGTLADLRLACVHFPHHCPCAWPDQEDKFELADGSRVCVSKGGFKETEAARKVELARKGLL